MNPTKLAVLANDIARKLEQAPVNNAAAAPTQQAGFTTRSLDTTAEPVVFHTGDVYGIHVLRVGTDQSAAVRVETPAGTWDMYAGDWVEGYFQGVKFSQATGGTVAVLLVTEAGVRVGHYDAADVQEAEAARVGPGGANSQTVNSAAGNVPTTAGDGVELEERISRVRVFVSAESGQTLSGGGSVRIWAWSTTLSRWAPTNIVFEVPSGSRDAMVGEFETPSYGAVYAEAVSVTASGGTTLLVTMEAYT